jgi:peptide/nickel transport system substrate-binding protein
MFGYREDASKRYTHDPAKAEEYFKKVDGGKWWDSGFDLTLYFNTGNDAREKGCNLFKTALEALNSKFHITVQGLDWPTYLDKNKKHELPVFFLGWAPDYADPDDYVLPFLHSVKGYYPYTVSYQDTAMDSLIDQAATELDKNKRAQLYSQIQDLDYTDSPFIWNLQSTTYHVERTWVVGYYYNPMQAGGFYWTLMKAIV